ncbi:uncharacterized protein ACLA_081630 [Aspergillus clavatus NRRL 1]|uniref:Telomere replication protein EST3 n=1 Tax=Aspergillus clavatus (strain ATCC 1007 / CBS 513.65 / DSM 816 / NCTC 3887 / NRRL 1 / QM 1276 / 107) TaxID=344612 RepID=A1CT36_ASPCL|nr:uncharacterized protein ACLA_081630 [Aspergillus clavatus NRRL 1]EAW06473.1 conserved hypothetical protein [Aspergillus clavatus NRRL 1]
MPSSEIWIAPLIERALKNYLDGQESQINLEDDGSNLRFSGYNERSAMIVKREENVADGFNFAVQWTEGEGLPIPNITDTTTQIQAKLARESLEEYSRDYPDWPLSEDRMRGYTINLRDFELVFEYATSEPKVHLYIKRFNIAWEKSKYKGPPQGRIIRRNVQVSQIMRTVFQKARLRETACSGDADDGDRSDCSINSQNGNSAGNTGRQEGLMSQIPPVDSTGSLLEISKENLKANAKKLLRPLNTHVQLPQAVHPKVFDVAAANTTTEDLPTPQGVAEKANSSQPAVLHCNEQSPCPQPPVSAPTEETVGQVESPTARPSDIVTCKPADEPQPQDVDGVAPSRSDVETTPNDHNQSTSDHPSPDRQKQRHPAAKSSMNNSDSISKKPPGDSCITNADPWDGMTKILEADITIPKDQAELLEQNKSWVPPEPGKPYPKGNVPPRLLEQWNTIALRRNHQAMEREKERALESSGSRVSRSPSRSISSSDSDPGTNVSWSQSDKEMSPQRAQFEHLPLDSSPSIRKSIDRSTHHLGEEGNPPTEVSLDNAQEGQELEQIHATVRPEEHEKAIEPNEAQELREPVEVPSAISIEPSGDGSVPEVSEIDHLTTQTCTQDLQDESDRMSEDSVMDTSVPLPLEVDPSPDQDIDSSAPSLPGFSTQLRVQVMETPAAHLHRHHPGDEGIEKQDVEVHNLEHLSSQVAKSSSQSRILNTFCSSDERNGSKSQDTPHPAQPNGSLESNEVNILGTQLSGGNWSYRDTTPISNSAVVLNSSEPGQHDANIIMIESSGQTEKSSHPFSSYREAPFMQTDDENQSIPSPTQYTPRRPDGHQMPFLKRKASETETEQLSPTKRQKMMGGNETMSSTQGIASNIMSRRQTYINRSVEYAEAQRVYDKFRSDYPDYTGDFDHFAMLCSKLHSLRAQGSLKRSFLWDDFIIMHLKEYPGHQEQTLNLEGKSITYEEYFLFNFSRPAYKKRSLTATGIEISATQHGSSSATIIPTVTRQETNTSFTGSLVDRFTNFHARSFGPETSDPWPEVDASLLSRESLTVDREEQNDSNSLSKDDTLVEKRAGKPTYPETSPTSTSHESFHNASVQILSSPTRKSPNTQPTPRTNSPIDVPREQDDDRSIPESEHGRVEVEEDLMDETHEVASVELGDDEPSSAPAQLSDAESDAVSEADSFEEDWVESHMRRLQRSGPFWSDDPNTPFKIFARADANVLSERMRRGGVPLPVDENGVIQPLVQYSIPPVREFLNRVGNYFSLPSQESSHTQARPAPTDD